MTRSTIARRPAVLLAALSAFAILSGCSVGAPGAAPDSDGGQAPVDGGSAGERIEYTGESEAHVVLDGTPMRFAGDGTPDGGMCVQSSRGVLSVELHVVEVAGSAYDGSGSNPELVLELPSPGAQTDKVPGVHIIVAGAWVAGDSPANVMDVDTPDVTLTVDGATVSGTQTMVPATGVGTAEPVEVEFEVQCR